MIRVALPLAALVLVGAKAPADPFAGRVAVGTQRCVDQFGNEPVVIVDQRTLLYRGTKRLYRSDLGAGCPGLRPDDILVIERFGTQLCAGDTFRTIEQGTSFPGPACRFGPFTAFDKPKR